MNWLIKNRIGFYFILVVVVLLFCQLITYIVINTKIPFLLNQKILFYFSPAYSAIVMALLILCFIAFSLYEIRKENKKLSRIIFFSLILGAGLSNLVDRLLRGGVVDYFNFLYWQMNIADIIIVAGVVLLVCQALIDRKGIKN